MDVPAEDMPVAFYVFATEGAGQVQEGRQQPDQQEKDG
jgi:hypothetical protein